MKLVFTGIQWCGKGTQARKLIENYGFSLVEMGSALRDIAKTYTPLGSKVKATIDAWFQVDPPIVREVIEEVIHNETSTRVIYDGFIRNLGNKIDMDELCPDYKVVFFHLSKEKAMERLLGRMFDPLTQETFPSYFRVNPRTWTHLEKRKDDYEDSIMNRITAFYEKTLPIVEIQKAEGKVIEINADQSIDEVYVEMIAKLEL